MPRRVQKYHDEGNIWEEDSEYRSRRQGGERPKAPLMLRVLAWGGVILLCFVGGYIGTSWVIELLNRPFSPNIIIPYNVIPPGGTGNFTEDSLDIRKLTLNLFYPRDGVLISESFELISGIREQEIRETVERLFSISRMFTREVSVRHVFRNASTLYINVAGPFIPMLSNAGQEQSELFITGIVRTMVDNFPPITEVRFLVNGALTTAGAPVDLTAAWRLP